MDGKRSPGTELVEKYAIKHRGCYGCFFHCDHYFTVKEGKYQGTRVPGLEYEATNGLGPRLGNTDFPSILYCINLVNNYGLDVVSTGGAIALAMDLYERGILTKDAADGMEIRWGDDEVIVALIHKIAKREGIGDLLGGRTLLGGSQTRPGGAGPGHARQKTGPNRCGGPAVQGPGAQDMTSTRGADHLRGLLKAEALGHQVTMEQAIKLFGTPDVTKPTLYDKVGKPKGVYYYQKLSAICDCLEICKFNTFWCGYDIYFDDMAKLLSSATGVEFREEDLNRLGERVWNLEKAINTREGYTREDDMPCERMMTEPIPRGQFKGQYLDKEKFSEMLDAYYEVTGCDVKTGIPTEETLSSLGLNDVARSLKEMEKLPAKGLIHKFGDVLTGSSCETQRAQRTQEILLCLFFLYTLCARGSAYFCWCAFRRGTACDADTKTNKIEASW